MKFSLDIKGTIAPFSAIARAFEHPKTICYPSQKKEKVDGYRGFHTNLLESCIVVPTVKIYV